MPLPVRMKPTKVSSKTIKDLAKKANEILSTIDRGAQEDDAALKTMMQEWNSQVTCPYEFSDFRDFSSWTSATEFTRIAFNQEKFYEDFTWQELVQVLEFVCKAEGKDSDQNFAVRFA